MVLGFAGVIALGTAVLWLPIAHEPGAEVSLLDAAFTAVSAVCVTGLIVVDTPVAFSFFGEIVILVLIQVGGLGIMLVASLIGLTLARRMRLRSRVVTATENRSVTLGDAGRLARGILLTSLLIEATVAIVLSVRFALTYGYEAGEAAWLGIFHAVSSFNNAGFSLFSDSMVGFATDPIVVLPMCGAIILGGLGFPVLLQLRKEFRRPLHWSMNTNLVLSMTAVLLVAGTIWIAVN